MRKPFSFGLVRYVHDPVGGEFLNVGVAVYSPVGRFLKARCTQRYSRISCAFGEVSGQHVRSLMGYVERRLNAYGRQIRASDEGLPENPSVLFAKLFAIDDSSLQFGSGGGGLAEDLEAALDQLYDRYVGQFETEPTRGRGDGAVWRESRKALVDVGLVQHLTTHRVSSDTYSYNFQHALKNGCWNALEPVSLDLSSVGKIKDKANKWLGRTHNLADATDDLKLYYLLGRPELESMRQAYDQAKDILHKTPIPHEIVEEDEVVDMAAELQQKLREHEDPSLGLDASA